MLPSRLTLALGIGEVHFTYTTEMVIQTEHQMCLLVHQLIRTFGTDLLIFDVVKAK